MHVISSERTDTNVTGPDQALALDAERAVWREIGDEVIILDVPTATYLNLNGSARLLWKRLDSGATPVDLAAELVTIYGIPEGQAAHDVESFLEALQNRSLLACPTPRASSQMGRTLAQP